MKLEKDCINDYSEQEFLKILKEFWEGDISEVEEDEFVQSFNEIIEHPEKSDLIFYPPDNRDDSPEGVINELKRWYREQGKACFRA
ncbi:bacteriocin immunity protein [Marinobacter halodurans]|uniref:bacteriocin immunity protein n=1 Tax=Marinobacter halodurans TaxID=2528979 RepID=UPI001A95586D|nr:bacteriocin immunity protein [Marinobacter halodurans]